MGVVSRVKSAEKRSSILETILMSTPFYLAGTAKVWDSVVDPQGSKLISFPHQTRKETARP